MIRKVLLLLASIVVTLALLELALRVAARHVSTERGGRRANTTILCVGDSHTFGLHVLPAAAYPARLQAALDPAARDVGVVNYGVPGRNSAALLRALPRYLDDVRPDLVLVLVGFNDSWNFDGRAEPDSAEPEASGFASFFRDLRLLKLLRLVRLNAAGRGEPEAAGPRVFERDGKMWVVEDGVERPAAVGGPSFGVVLGAELEARVGRNVEAIVAAVRSHGARPVLLTYATEAQPTFVDLNRGARALASRLGVDLIDAAESFRPEIARAGYAALFFGDDHPNARGNELFAGFVAAELAKRGLVRPVAAGPAPPAAPVALTAKVGADGRATFEVLTSPGRDFQVVLSPVREPAYVLDGKAIPIGNDPMLARCLVSPNLRGRADASGRGRLELGVDFLWSGGRPAGVARLYAVAAVFDAAGSSPRVSDVVALDVPPR